MGWTLIKFRLNVGVNPNRLHLFWSASNVRNAAMSTEPMEAISTSAAAQSARAARRGCQSVEGVKSCPYSQFATRHPELGWHWCLELPMKRDGAGAFMPEVLDGPKKLEGRAQA